MSKPFAYMLFVVGEEPREVNNRSISPDALKEANVSPGSCLYGLFTGRWYVLDSQQIWTTPLLHNVPSEFKAWALIHLDPL